MHKFEEKCMIAFFAFCETQFTVEFELYFRTQHKLCLKKTFGETI